MSTLGPLTPAFEARWDDAAQRSELVDGWADCWGTSLLWGRAIAQAFLPSAAPLGAVVGDSALAVLRHLPEGEESPALLPLDAVWGFGASLVGPLGDGDVDELIGVLDDAAPQLCILSGLQEGSPAWGRLVQGLGDRFPLGLGEERVRCHASLAGGIDGYLARRSRLFRRNLRQMERRTSGAGITVEVIDRDDPNRILARLHGIERDSWKGIGGSGIEAAEMSTLYDGLVRELHAVDRLRAAIAVGPDGADLAFILGGLRSGLYRGLQVSFREQVRPLGLGNLLQWHEIRRLCEDDTMHTYDLGMDIEYKRAWAERYPATRMLLIDTF